MKTRDINATDSAVSTEEVQETKTKATQPLSPSTTPRQRAPRAASKAAAAPQPLVEVQTRNEELPLVVMEHAVERDVMPQERRDMQQPREDFNRPMPQSSQQSYNNERSSYTKRP